MRVVVTGSTGYIGGRLVPVLLERGHEVVCGARTPAKLDARPWRGDVEVAAIDVTDPDSLRCAFDGADAVYHLVHAMDGEGDFAQRDREAAANVRDAAAAGGVSRIVYLGGLGHEDGPRPLSEHLRSRQEVGRVLADGPVAVTELRAAIIIGSGSASFEMLRSLVEVLPIMTTPKWVSTRCQPIAVRDVLTYLAGVLEVEEAASEVLEIGGPDVMTYAELMQTYAHVAGLRKRVILPVPVLSPGLSSLWIGLVTPLPTGLARPLVDSLVNEVIVRDARIDELLPKPTIPFTEAVRLALQRIQDLDVATTWASAGGRLPMGGVVTGPVPQPGEGPTEQGRARTVEGQLRDPGLGPTRRPVDRSGPERSQPDDPDWAGGTVFEDERRVRAAASPEALFQAVCGIGGQTGYHSARWLWELRGLLDKLVGGIGLRRGRRHPSELSVGEVIDFWRVEALERPSLLRLRAEMKVPGEAWLEFRIDEFEGGSRLIQRARFHPRGLWGRMYWGVLVPFHGLIFPIMARRLARAAERTDG
ncbi:MAG: SDR family oxidoreductase [Nitriliruptoraceae bacterium]|nr:SDR family oxidoreductase [Nitriliruptoraceae bacterium]